MKNCVKKYFKVHLENRCSPYRHTDITDAELRLTGYVMFRRDQIGRRGGGVILYVKESIQAYEIKLESEADYDEAVWCKIVSRNSINYWISLLKSKHKQRG